MKNCAILGGSSHPELVRRICHSLDIEPVLVETRSFSNGETGVNITSSVRDKQVYVIQTATLSSNDALMELLIMVSACKSASSRSVTVVLPLFPYSRQASVKDALRATSLAKDILSSPPVDQTFSDRESGLLERIIHVPIQTPQASPVKPSRGGASVSEPASNASDRPGLLHARSSSNIRPGRLSDTPTPTKEWELEHANGYRYWVAQVGPLIASLLSVAGADHIITLDLHDPQFQGFFDIPVDNLHAQPLIAGYISGHIPNYRDAVVVSPDAGGAKRATSIADRLGLRFALMHKDGRNNATILVGNVANRVAVIIDDLVDTARTLIRAARVIKEHGATRIYAIVTHGVLSGSAVHQLIRSPIDQLVTTNSVALTEAKEVLGDRLKILDVAPMFGEAIRRIHNGESISVLFEHDVEVL